MIKEVIQVISTDQKQGAKGPYLEILYRDAKGQERKKNIFDQTLWNLFGDGLWVEWQLEKEGTWWNVKSAQGVKEGLPPAVKPDFKSENRAEIAPQERGMWWKEIGELIRTDKLRAVFGEKDSLIITRAYKLQAIASLGITAKKED